MSMQGSVVEIWTACDAGSPMQAQESATAIADVGLSGDRYGTQDGSFSRPDDGPDRQLTFIAKEELVWLQETHGIDMTAADSRRNILTEGVHLNSLVGQRFSVGEVEVEGMRLCQPCKQLADILGFDFAHLMVNRGGLNCRILTSGTIRVGDAVALGND